MIKPTLNSGVGDTNSNLETFIENYKCAVKKANTPLFKTFLLGVMAGVFISLAWIASIWGTRKLQDSGMYNVVFGGTFLVAIIMIIFMGGEMFTGNALIFIPAMKKQVKWRRFFANLLVVLIGNIIGASIIALLTWGSGFLKDTDFVSNAWTITMGKLHKEWYNHLFSGMLCNLLIGGSFYITYSSKSAIGKIALSSMLIFPFALTGFSHVVANSYLWTLLPIFNVTDHTTTFSDWLKFGYSTQLPTLIGNFIGGAFLLMGSYYLIFRKELPNPIEL